MKAKILKMHDKKKKPSKITVSDFSLAFSILVFVFVIVNSIVR